jgi:hypothetical protein
LNNSQELDDEEENLFRDVITDGGVFDDTRFKGIVPHYEKFNTRQYFHSIEGYMNNQPDEQEYNI